MGSKLQWPNVLHRTCIQLHKSMIIHTIYPRPSLHFTSHHFTSLHFTSLHFTSLHFASLRLLRIQHNRDKSPEILMQVLSFHSESWISSHFGYPLNKELHFHWSELLTLVLTCIGLVCKMPSSFCTCLYCPCSFREFHVFSTLKRKPTGRNERHGDHTCQVRQGAGPPGDTKCLRRGSH
jgi:hypothetical protein